MQELKWNDEYQKYPEATDNYDRFLGIAWNTGDELTYHIEISKDKSNNPDLSHSEPFKYISRGTVEPHYGANKRVGENISNADQFDRIKSNVDNNYNLKLKNDKKY